MLRLISCGCGCGGTYNFCNGRRPNGNYSISKEVIIPHSGMTRLKPGDRVDCRIESATIVGPYENYDEVKTFEIVAKDSRGYYLYIPHYYFLHGTITVDQYQCKKLGIDNKFINENIIYIQENMIAYVQEELDGLNCTICKEFFMYAEPNQSDGTLICFSCRSNPYR